MPAASSPPRDMRHIVLVRHAETAWNLSHRYYAGRDDPDLTAAGEREAMLLRSYLSSYRDAQCAVSPALRARRTASLAGLAPAVSVGLREWSFRLSDRHTVGDACEQATCQHDVWDTAVHAACAGECLPQVTARADQVLDWAGRLLADGRDVVLVSHGNFIRVMTARWLGLPAATGAHLALRTASISRLAIYDGRPALLGWNLSPAFDGCTMAPAPGDDPSIWPEPSPTPADSHLPKDTVTG